MLVPDVIAPVLLFNVNPPGVDEYVPPAVPVRVTLIVPAFVQYGEPG